MKKLLTALGLAGLLSLASLAVATGGTATPSVSLGACLDGWYVNPDEVSRKPTPTAAGLKFEGDQLVHHSTMISVASLIPGTYVASPAPDQPSFFSVEVRNPSGAYGTLRWNPTTSKWSITIGAGNGATAGTFEDASPVALLAGKVTKWGAFEPATDLVVTFGVGYTKSPPGTVATVVSSVTFGGTTYSLKCASSSSSTSASASASSTSSSPAASSSSSASASPSGSSAPPSTSASASTSTTPAPVLNAGNRLPTTGSNMIPVLAGVGGALLLAGAAILGVLWLRRRPTFEPEEY